jgi:pimeloyl-ACP methyl ester carboxylesterase
MGRPWFLRAVYPVFSRWYMRARTSADRRARADAIAVTRTAAGAKAVAEMWRGFARPEHGLHGLAPQITAPTVVIWGRHDPILSVEIGRAAHQLIPGSELVVADSGHCPQTGDPETVAARLVALLEAGSSPAGR